METGTIKQILLITDGGSNEGKDPVAVATMAPQFGVSINVIGILSQSEQGAGLEEVKNIAAAGGGIHQLVQPAQLPKTVQMVTRKAMTQTIHNVVNKELKQILGQDEAVTSLPPDKRQQVVEVVEEMGETSNLEVLILVDTSASMRTKIPAVKQALRDLAISMSSRIGQNRFSLWTFPAGDKQAERQMDWASEFSNLERHFQALAVAGRTPTGPALEKALDFFNQGTARADDEEGHLSDYVF